MIEADRLSSHTIQEISPIKLDGALVENMEITGESGRLAVGTLRKYNPEFTLPDNFLNKAPTPESRVFDALSELSRFVAGVDVIEKSKRKGLEVNLRFVQPIFHEDTIRLEAEISNEKANTPTSNVKAIKGDEIVAEGEIVFGLDNNKEQPM